MTTLPSYNQVCRGFGFPVPKSYYRLIELAFRITPTNPWNAFRELDILYFDATSANPDYVYPGHDYPDTPVEIHVIAWGGTDGTHYGFIVDDLPSAPHELPIAEVYPNSGCRVLGMNISEFIGLRIAETIRDCGKKWYEENCNLIDLLMSVFTIPIPADIDEHLARCQLRRAQCGAVITLDGCGAVLPQGRIDWQTWEQIDWEKHRGGKDIPDRLLMEAESRMMRGDDITAFLIARNFRYLYWHSDFNSNRQYIQRTAAIMERVYGHLGRVHLARKIRDQTDWAVREVR